MTTPLSQARADAVICRAATRALLQHLDFKRYRDDEDVPKVGPRVRPEQVAATVATYYGVALPLPLPTYYVENLAALEDMIANPLGPPIDEFVYTSFEHGPTPRRRWLSR